MTRRIIAVSADTTFAEKLATAIGDPDTRVETDAGAEAALWVLDLDHTTARERLAGVPSGARIVVVVSRGSLGDIVDVWSGDDRILGCATDPLGAATLALRALADEPPRIESLLVEGAASHTATIADHDDKLRSVEEVSAFAERRLKGRDATRTAIEQSIDELLMNALYAAPIAADGSRVFAGVSVKQRATQRTGATVTLGYGADASRFALVVRDEFGSLDRATVLRVLHKGVHAEDKVDARAGGAGLGLFLVASAASSVYFDVAPGGGCEITCLFDVGGTTSPVSLGFFARPAHTSRRTARAERSAASKRRRARIGIAAVAAIATLAALVAASRGPGMDRLAIRARPGTAIEVDGAPFGSVGDDGVLVVPDAGDERHLVIARLAGHAPQRAVVRAPYAITFELAPVSAVALDSQPSGALVLDGNHVLGVTPLTLPALTPGTRKALALDKPGYRRATVQVDAPAAGQVVRVVQPLERAPDLVRVRLVSNPPGAEVRRADEPATADRMFTPADVYVKAGARHRFTLVMRAHTPLAVEVGGTEGEVAGGDLVPE
ncbi:MAG: PEGA domain-containing protein [Myxococcota bacterium]|nr:PEGA domain-containing protein [Myxococcota bacterium]